MFAGRMYSLVGRQGMVRSCIDRSSGLQLFPFGRTCLELSVLELCIFRLMRLDRRSFSRPERKVCVLSGENVTTKKSVPGNITYKAANKASALAKCFIRFRFT